MLRALRINARALAKGIATLFGVVALGSLYGTQLGSLAHPVALGLYVAAWLIPGYVAAAIAGGNGAVHGVAIGLVSGAIVTGFTALFDASPLPGEEVVSVAWFGIGFGVAAALLCGLGGLAWHLKQFLSR